MTIYTLSICGEGYSKSNKGFNEMIKQQDQCDQIPSTSRHCKKLSRSPLKKAGGKVNKCKKIVDEKTRRLVKRSVYIVNNDKTLKVTSKKVSPQKKNSKRFINSSNTNKSNVIVVSRTNNKNIPSVNGTLEEGELRSDTNKSFENGDDDDDCICIEPTLEEISIDDFEEDDIPSTSNTFTHYQSLIHSFEKRVSSTPCPNKKTPTSYVTTPNIFNENNNDSDQFKVDETLPFFLDVCRGTKSKHYIDNCTDYTKLSTLREKSVPTRRSVRLKSNCEGVEVITLDEISDDEIEFTLKNKSEGLEDDSVIFVSETNKNDFIPIVDDNIPPQRILKISEPAGPTTPANKRSTNILFTQSETKKLNEYNENAYNPSATKELTSGKRIVILDGSNVAFKHGLDQGFSVKGLKIAIEYFEKMGHEVKAVIPQFRMNRTKSTDPDELERLHKAGKIVQTPCKNLPGHTSTSYDDRFILQLAFALDAVIVSNDNYRDLLQENPAFKKIIENRVVGYTWCNDIFIIPKDPYGKWGPQLHTILNRC